MVQLSMGYKELIGDTLKATEGRDIYHAAEVRDILLDLWLLLETEEKEPVSA